LNNQDYPYEILKEKIIDNSPFKKNELFSILFNYLPEYVDKKITIPDFQIEPLAINEISPKFDMTLYLYERQAGIEINVVYKSNIYNEDSIGRLLRNFLAGMHRVLGDANLSTALLTAGVKDDFPVMKTDEIDEFEKYFDEGEF
jgi:fengycin family lipopeptide synthetase D